MSTSDVHTLLEIALTAIWVLVDLGLAILALYRFRVTPAGILMGMSFALMSLKNLFASLLWHLFLNPALDRGWDMYGSYESIELLRTLYFLGRTGLSFVLMGALAVGILLIPYSLGRLRPGPATPPPFQPPPPGPYY